jgi:hypothetical protein
VQGGKGESLPLLSDAVRPSNDCSPHSLGRPRPQLRRRPGRVPLVATGVQGELSAADIEQLNRRAIADAFRFAAFPGAAVGLALVIT